MVRTALQRRKKAIERRTRLLIPLTISYLLLGIVGGCGSCLALASINHPGTGLLLFVGLFVVGFVCLVYYSRDQTNLPGEIVAVGVMVATLLLVSLSPFYIPSGAESSDSCGAWVMAKEFVKEKLKSPSTARFDDGLAGPQGCTNARSLGGDRYSVSGHVDSENSFGATTRSIFSCTLSMDKDGTWHLESISVL